jgi:hypothetical protein
LRDNPALAGRPIRLRQSPGSSIPDKEDRKRYDGS